MIYEIMNCEDFRENKTSFIVGLELADEFVADIYDSDEEFFYEYTEEEIEDMLNESEFFVCSRNIYEDGDVEYFIEPLLHDEGRQYYLESDLVFIEDDLVDVVDIDKISSEEIFTFTIEEDENFEYNFFCGELEEKEIEEVDEDEDCECDYYYAGFKDGYNQAICEAIDMLYDKLKVE